jgi:GDP-L-fucose synthase
MSFWKNKRVMVTGGNGFLGQYVVEAIKLREPQAVFVPSHANYDLRSRVSVDDAYDFIHPHIVIHLAAALGGIGANAANPGKFFYDNIVMGAEMMDAAREHGVQKFIQVGTSCSYPAQAPTPVKESDLWSGAPNPVTGPYGIAKLALITMAQAYRQQYGLDAITLIPVNLYGPRDSFDTAKSHVIPALVMNSLSAKEKGTPLTVWGTGNATREFLYVSEAAEAIVLAAEKYSKPEPINLGTGVEVFIKDLVSMITRATGFTGEVVWDNTKPDGQLRRCFDVTRAREEFGFEAKMSLEEGIQKTVDWYLQK